ncbi:hypothetical protein [Streptomyces sp. CMB-StM0423]|uniref:hypothetical protein n=1 Tax=Streptomyces sp. CMB-StM0423 TaxID=2059884 RepID=UPI000C7073CD|nr:hypothetical protein [Streptomyces sp. CMB-StM0423]AUH43155.1 hypothetical protein CXR04_25960 [Streptomyces sp. CMB-StM0423]
MRRRTSAIAGLLATATASLALLTGCTADGTSTGAAGPESGRDRELTRAEQARLDEAEQRLVQRCMARQDFPYWIFPRVSADTERAFSDDFVQDDVAWAREHGYGGRLKKAFFAEKKRDRNLAYRQSLSPGARERYTTALSGGPDTPVRSVKLPGGGTVGTMLGGCEFTARKELYGDVDAFFRADKIATNLSGLYSPRLMRDRRYTAGVSAWSSCMKKATGRAYATPAATRADAAERTGGLSGKRAHAVEAGLAVAEATCSRQTSLAATLAALDREYGDPVRKRYGEEIATADSMRLAALERADRAS